jgi:signal transduction histidine kinase
VTVNGSGPRRPRDDHGGFGLGTMRQRIEEVGGRLEVEAEPGAGTAISAAVPFAADGASL